MLFIANHGGQPLRSRFSQTIRLRSALTTGNSRRQLTLIRHTASLTQVRCIQRKSPHKLNRTILVKRRRIKSRPFTILLNSSLVSPHSPILDRVVRIHRQFNNSILYLVRIPHSRVSLCNYTTIRTIRNSVIHIASLVRGPNISRTPDSLTIVNHCIVSPTIFNILRHASPNHNKRVRLASTLRILTDAPTSRNKNIRNIVFQKHHCSAKSQLSCLRTIVQLTLRHSSLNPPLHT